MDVFATRRGFFRAVAAGIAETGWATAERDSPAGTIRVQGWKATFEVEYGRLMESVAYTFIHEYGWRITFEEAPLFYGGDIVDVTRDFSRGIRAYNPPGRAAGVHLRVGARGAAAGGSGEGAADSDRGLPPGRVSGAVQAADGG